MSERLGNLSFFELSKSVPITALCISIKNHGIFTNNVAMTTDIGVSSLSFDNISIKMFVIVLVAVPNSWFNFYGHLKLHIGAK